MLLCVFPQYSSLGRTVRESSYIAIAFLRFRVRSPMVQAYHALPISFCVSAHSDGNASLVRTVKAALKAAMAFLKFSYWSPSGSSVNVRPKLVCVCAHQPEWISLV